MREGFHPRPKAEQDTLGVIKGVLHVHVGSSWDRQITPELSTGMKVEGRFAAVYPGYDVPLETHKHLLELKEVHCKNYNASYQAE